MILSHEERVAELIELAVYQRVSLAEIVVRLQDRIIELEERLETLEYYVEYIE